MLLFLLGLVVGGILGIALICILSAGSMADEKVELMSKNLTNSLLEKQNIIISKH